MYRRYLPPLLAVLCVLAVSAAPALAAEARPGWMVSSDSEPSNLAPGGTGKLNVDLFNIGDAPSSGSVTLVDTLPAGVTATSVDLSGTSAQTGQPFWSCADATNVNISPGTETDQAVAITLAPGTSVVTCTSHESLPVVEAGEAAGSAIHADMDIFVAVSPGAPEAGSNTVRVSGGGALQPAVERRSQVVSAAPASFGFQDFQQVFVNEDGTPDTQAGSHPAKSITTFSLNTSNQEEEVAGGELRDLEVDLPPGIIGDPHATPLCSREDFDKRAIEGYPQCPPDTQIGTEVLTPAGIGVQGAPIPIYNLVPPAGYPAQFGFAVGGKLGFIDVGVQGAANDSVKLFLRELSEVHIFRSVTTLWGVPAASSHTPFRREMGLPEGSGRVSLEGAELKPFVSLPTSCTEPLAIGVKASSWSEPADVSERSFPVVDPSGEVATLTGCDTLEFDPTATVTMDTGKADTPAGLTAEVKVPASGLSNPEGDSAADIEDTRVSLPAGVVINPGQAAGLQACQPAQAAIGVEGPVSCPAASKVGTVEISTPLLSDKLEGSVYILPSDPPNLQLLVAAQADGVLIKLLGNVTLNPLTGQLVTTFTGTPQLPFTDLKLSFSGGAQAALATPAQCGSYQTTADFTPWSAPEQLDVLATSSFLINQNSEGGPCPSSPLPFSPSLIAGATTDQAGGYTDFSLLLQRGDDQQRVSRLQFKTPAGLLGMISKVALCDEADANAGTCPAASQIGHTVVTSGPGPYPLVVPEPGQAPAPIYLTGGYDGAPYGLSIVVPLHVGPFTLPTQIVRASIAVDPHTAQLTVTTDPLPSIVGGIPTDLRSVDAVIDREGFMFNPTNCSPQSFSGTALGAEGATAAISSHFQVGSCQSLKFAPDFKVSTPGKTSKADGAGLNAEIVYPTGSLGDNQASSQANIASVKVDLPKQLPSRLTTLQKACLAKVFEADPANCPAESVVGHATAVSPVLPVALNGPAYFVSHGGEAFPSLIVVLQGYGVTVDLVGTTFISKAGITSSTFKQVPDVPITTFDLNLPEGKFSALAANLPPRAKYSFCGQSLTMPTAFTGQNGAVIHQTTKLTISGCPQTKKAATKKRKAGKAKKTSAKGGKS
jgi:uncharacterized repeat protein (TIGR01451 family)